MIEVGLLVSAKYNDGGALESQIALQGPGASCTAALAYSPFGFKGRPRAADAPDSTGTYKNGALVLYWYEGSVLHSMPLDDGRRSTQLPPLDEGGSQWYGDTDDAVSFYDGSGNLTLRAPKAATIKIADKGTPVKIGDSPAPLALASAISDLQAAITSWTPVSQDGGAALKTALATFLAKVYATTELQAT